MKIKLERYHGKGQGRPVIFWKETQHGREIKPGEPFWRVRWLHCRGNGDTVRGMHHLWIYTKLGAIFLSWPPKLKGQNHDKSNEPHDPA